jgi:hypothetical protein
MTGETHEGPVFVAGERASVAVAARIGADVSNPEVVIQFRDVRGYVLYGIATRPEDLQVSASGGERLVSARLEVPLTLGPGDYGVTVGFVDRQGESVVTVLDKVVSALTFTIAPIAGGRAHGPVDLGARWRAPHVS